MTIRSPQDVHLGKALGKIPGGLFILAVRHGGLDAGALVSWVQQAAFEPPSVVLAVGKQRPFGGLIERAGTFTLSVLGSADMALMKRFARGVEPGSEVFTGLNTGEAASGQPYLADALAWLECRLVRVVDFEADHNLLVANVIGGQVLKEGASFTHLRGSGFHY